MGNPLDQIMDAVDVETFFVCASEEAGKSMMIALLKQWGFTDIDVVFAQHEGPGVRVRGRAYVYRPADKYQWLLTEKQGGDRNGTQSTTSAP